MKEQLAGAELLDDYTRLLRDYLMAAESEGLEEATRLGRRAMTEDLGVLDMVELHHRALSRVLMDGEAYGSTEEVLGAAQVFLSDALSPFEITHRGFREATEVRQRIDLFASVVCHDLVTSLTSLLVSAGAVQDLVAADPSSPEGKIIANVLSAAARVKARAEDLLDIVAFEAGTFSLDLVQLEPAELVRDVCRRLEPAVARAAMQLDVSVPATLPRIEGDPDRLEQVIANLVRNAVRHAAVGRRVVVRARARARAVEIEVEDDGPGVTPADQLRLFQPYFRGREKRGEAPDLGLGLMLCREIVTAHGGTISVKSEEGRGALFRVTLPVRRPARKREP